MTALVLANIPSTINTYERLAVWAIQCLQSISSNQEVLVQQNAAPVPIAQCQFSVTSDGVDRFILSGYLPCDRNAINSPTAKTWMATSDIGTAAPHTNLLSN